MSEKRASQPIVGSVTNGVPALAALSNAFTSGVANIGEATNVALLVKVDGAVTLLIQASDDFQPGAGRNQLDATNTIWYDYMRAQSLEAASGVEGNEAKIVFGGAGVICVDLSPFAPKYIRVTSANGSGVNAFVAVVTSG